jgi:prefoldin alpha subunit
MNNEEEVRRAAAVLDSQRAQLESLARQEEILQYSLEELLRARETVGNARQVGKGTEALVPVGAGAFLFMNVKDSDKALMSIGSDLVLEESVDKVLEKLDARVKEIEEASKTLSEKVSDLDDRVGVQARFVQDLYDRTKKVAPGA